MTKNAKIKNVSVSVFNSSLMLMRNQTFFTLIKR